jgi:hypothetical protein
MKNIVIVSLLILSLGIVAAHDVEYKEKYSKTYYFEDDLRIVSKTTWIDYDNNKRFSTRDYRHGYSYRTSGDYFDKKYSDVFYKKKSYDLVSYREKDFRNYRDRYYFDSGLRYSYEYVPHLRSYEKRECYVSPPRDKLLYIKC